MKGFKRCPECEGLMCLVRGEDYNDYYKCSCGFCSPGPRVDLEGFDHMDFYY